MVKTVGKVMWHSRGCLPFICSAYSKNSALTELKVEVEKSVLGCSALQKMLPT